MGYEKKEARRIVRGEDGYFWNPPTPSRDSRLTTHACERARGRGDVARETIAEGERRKRREKERERERIKRERMKRERVKRENEDVDKTWQPRGGRNNKTVHNLQPQSGHRKRWCHNLDIK